MAMWSAEQLVYGDTNSSSLSIWSGTRASNIITYDDVKRAYNNVYPEKHKKELIPLRKLSFSEEVEKELKEWWPKL